MQLTFGHTDFADAQAVGQPAAHAVATGWQRDLPVSVGGLDHLGGNEAARVDEIVRAGGRRGRYVQALPLVGEVREHQIGVAFQVETEGWVLGSGRALSRVRHGARVGVGVGFGQRDPSVARTVSVAAQAANQVLREIAAADLV